MACYNCNSPYHKSNQCTKPKSSSSTCHKCKKPGHKSANCPMNSAAASSCSSSTCHKCKKPGHKFADCPMNSVIVSASAFSSSSTSYVSNSVPDVPIIVILNGMWGKNSAIVDENCALTQLKRMMNIFSTEEDKRNSTPHINIDGDQEIYDKINGVNILLRFTHLRINKDYIDIDVGFGKHFTLVYKKNIKDSDNFSERLKSIWVEWTNYCLPNSNVSKEESKECKESKREIVVVTEIDNTCAICMNARRDCLIDCPHFVMCYECGKTVNKCPICREPITVRIKKMINM